MRELAAEYKGRVVVTKINVDEHPEIAKRFGVRALPTTIIFHNGSVVGKLEGNQPKQVFVKKLDWLLLGS